MIETVVQTIGMIFVGVILICLVSTILNYIFNILICLKVVKKIGWLKNKN